MKPELETILPEFGEAIRPHIYSYVTANKHATARQVLFMAGSPAAGKTELLNRLIEQHGLTNIVRIDADDFRWWFPYYNEENSTEYQKPASKMVDFIYKKALSEGYPIVMDSTFSSIGIAEQNFDRALRAGYQVMLNYVYFDPTHAWVYAQARSRKVPLEVLKKNFFKSRETIEHMLTKYAGQFTLNVYHRREDPENVGQFLVDYTSNVTLATWTTSHHCPYSDVSDLAHIGV
ncbi:zeta toxin family protein [Enterobacter hormaechei]|uniref:zeta toxin family protein n=1 Tax=Enterobacter hormaechei TaxID=158836 RepID=UPI001BE03D96|nr:zeta toxin family protein [Enterobacter hormaechei subsp. xiangfangensis]HAV1851624.1 AAA family ATPase [Enterobacter hormaechei subsp. xiangfangensis]